jgi:hypothetical protein
LCAVRDAVALITQRSGSSPPTKSFRSGPETGVTERSELSPIMRDKTDSTFDPMSVRLPHFGINLNLPSYIYQMIGADREV